MTDTDKRKDFNGNEIDVDELLAEIKRLRKDIVALFAAIEGYKAIWDYLDPKGYAWEEEEFVALLKEHGFETGDE